MPRNFTPGGSPWQRTADNAKNCTGKTGDSITCLNDQGGRVMSVSKDITATLRAEEHGHQPCVMQSSGFCTEHSTKMRRNAPLPLERVLSQVQSCPLNRALLLELVAILTKT